MRLRGSRKLDELGKLLGAVEPSDVSTVFVRDETRAISKDVDGLSIEADEICRCSPRTIGRRSSANALFHDRVHCDGIEAGGELRRGAIQVSEFRRAAVSRHDLCLRNCTCSIVRHEGEGHSMDTSSIVGEDAATVVAAIWQHIEGAVELACAGIVAPASDGEAGSSSLRFAKAIQSVP